MLKVVIIGTGGHSLDHHGHACAMLGDSIDRAAVCSLDLEQAKKYAEETGFHQVYTDYETMIDEIQPDAIIAVLPVPQVYPVAAKLIPKRIPLLMEKPPGENSEQTAKLLAMAEDYGTTVMVSFNRRFSTALQRMKNFFVHHDLSDPLLLRATMFRSNRLEPDFIMSTAIHSLDAIIYLLGEPFDVDVKIIPEMPNALIAKMTFSNGCRGVFTLLPDTGVVKETYELSGQGYQLTADTVDCTYHAWVKNEMVDSYHPTPDATAAEISGGATETAYFLHQIENEKIPKPGLGHGLAVMRLAEKLQRAIDITQPSADK
tara:strand:- start:1 stop:948 length:948 start_codon:yes stop_codon:yes gene_type:complete